MYKPANSPDLNADVKAFKSFSIAKSNYTFLTLQLCMIEIMKVKGSHTYKIPHVNKALVQEVQEYLT